jgi:hypothetical protein
VYAEFRGRNQLFAYTEELAEHYGSKLGRKVSWGRIILSAVSPYTFPHEVGRCMIRY